MNLIKLQDTKLIHRNSFHSHTLTTKNQKEKLRKQPHSKSKIPRNKSTSRDKRLICRKLWDIYERSQSWHKQMERYTMFPDWKNQYCENNHTTQSNLQIECNSYQTTIDIFHRTRTKIFTIRMGPQKTLNG